MKLNYVAIFFGNAVSGVQKKLLSQVMCLNYIGLDSEILSITGAEDITPAEQHVRKIIIPSLELRSPDTILGKIRRNTLCDNAYKQIIGTLGTGDILYTRKPTPSRIIRNILKQPRKCKIIVEYQTKERGELWINRSYLGLINDLLYGNAIRRYTDGIVGVTNEITRYELTRSGNPKKPHITIGNGIDVASVSVRTPPRFNGETLNLLCVAYVSRWHGLDRLIMGVGSYGGPVKVTLHIVGGGTEIPQLKKLTNELNLTNKIIFHGAKTGQDLDYFFNICHIAIGSLGIHRIGLTEASTLKAREYCARGIPYLMACPDPDFSNDFDYIFKIPANEKAIEIENVVEFANCVLIDTDHPQKMRMYASKHLDWQIKMKKLKVFCEEIYHIHN
nr:glycosyltransferase [uncultured Methanoregula sp.]